MDFDDRRRAIICDIDNTILDIRHRFHYLNGENTDWDKFLSEDAIRQDVPMWDTVEVIGCLGKFYPIIFITGRNEGTRKITEEQISGLFKMTPLLNGKEIYMRTDGDYRQDIVIKKELYDKYVAPNYRIIAAFDDKPTVVELWRNLGITTYHVGEIASGDGF
uniref:Polynucleotide kinase PNKP phosphatase domain-containing protein n=1 Tax=Siphoviridae sp. ctYh54 TaxID=2826379 RepID=A0A8S5MDU0_9CAUD|nr:MAG TPA: hypothetical protein [Siphoviridae sp. ctYh54]